MLALLRFTGTEGAEVIQQLYSNKIWRDAIKELPSAVETEVSIGHSRTVGTQVVL